MVIGDGFSCLVCCGILALHALGTVPCPVLLGLDTTSGAQGVCLCFSGVMKHPTAYNSILSIPQQHNDTPLWPLCFHFLFRPLSTLSAGCYGTTLVEVARMRCRFGPVSAGPALQSLPTFSEHIHR